MVRPRRERRIFFQPDVSYFKPAGIPLRNLKEVSIGFDELEAIRMIDFKEMSQIDAGKKMKISQATLSRLLKTGRKKIASALVNGYSIKIQGGHFKLVIPKSIVSKSLNEGVRNKRDS